jgi:hypothetical protein
VTDEGTWSKIAWHHIDDARIDGQSLNVIKSQMMEYWAKDGSDLSADVKATRLVQKLQQNIALDTVRNEYILHAKLHGWLASGIVSDEVKTLNEKVYAELFLTPSSDPWLGLFSDDVYVGLDKGGVVR